MRIRDMERRVDGPGIPAVAAVPVPVSDAALVGAAVGGDRGAFAALVGRYQRAVVGTCLAVLKDRQLAEDAAQEAFVAAYRNLGGLRDPAAFGGWVARIARNRSVRVARERVRRNVVEGAGGRAPQAGSLNGKGWDEALLEAMGGLPDHERVVVVLRYFDGHDVAAVAAITGRPVGTVTKQLSRAHGRLRKALERRERP